MRRPSAPGAAARRGAAPYLVLLIGLLATVATANYVAETTRARDLARFDSNIRQTEWAIRARLDIYIAMLRATAALFAGSEAVTRDEFRAFVDRLRLDDNYPGIQGIGLTLRLTADNGDSVARLVEGFAPAGTIETIRDGTADHAIVYLEPLDRRNRAAIGYDMYSEPVRREAMELARDSALPVASGRVTLVQEIDERKQPGFLVYVPLYRGGVLPLDVEARHDLLEGFVYSPFRADDLLAGIVEGGMVPLRRLDFQLYDTTVVDPARLLHDSRRIAGTPPHPDPRYTVTRVARMAGRDWGLVFTSRPPIETSAAVVPLILLAGTAVSAGLFALTRAQVRARDAAERTAAELLRAQAETRAAERRFQSFVEQVRDYAIFMIDPAGRVTTWTPGVERILGYTETEFVGMPLERLLPAEGPTRAATLLAAAAERGEVSEDTWLVRRDGTRIWATGVTTALRDEAGRLTGFSKVVRDLTARKEAEERLRYQLDVIDTITRHADEALFLLDAEGHITYANPAAERLLGWSAEELAGRGLHDTVHFRHADGSEYPEGECPIARVLRSGVTLRDHEDEFVRRDGTTVPVACSNAPLLADGRVRGAVLVARDVTERRRTEQAMLQARKLESLGVLAGGIAHDFNNLLTGILGNVSLVREGMPEGSEGAALLDEALRATDRAAELVRQLLAYAGKGRILADRVRVNDVLGELRSAVEGSMPRKVRLELDPDPDDSMVTGDPDQLRQLLVSLVVNGIEAIGAESGTVTVQARRRSLDADATRRDFPGWDLPPGDYVAIAVRDTGCGMTEETRRRIFDPFFTTKFTGRGLGLAAALGIVRSHRGAIAVASAPGAGSTFTVVLSAADVPVRAATPAGASERFAPGPERG